MSQLCFLCSKEIDGDAEYYEYHLNRCLDDQTNTNTNASGSSSGSNKIEMKGVEFNNKDQNNNKFSRSNSKDSIMIETDEELAIRLDRETALAFSNQEQFQFEQEDTNVNDKCIMCLSSWSSLSIDPIKQPLAASRHVTQCIDSNSIDANSNSTSNSKSKSKSKQSQSKSNGDFPPEQMDIGCTLCYKTWAELGLTEEKDWNIRLTHVDNCEINQSGNGVDGGEDGIQVGYELGTGVGKVITGSPNLIPVLSLLLARSHKESRTKQAYLCSPSVLHIQSQFMDSLWGCGYRNAQMLFSSLRELDCYKALYAGNSIGGKAPIPTILELQEILEMAWRTGYDPAGAAHFKNKLKGSRKWIGTTEVYTAFVWLGLRVKIADFPSAKGSSSTTEPHEILIKWIQNYFSSSSTSTSPISTSPTGSKRTLPSSSVEPVDALKVLMDSKGTAIKETTKQPLYLQHQGHSRTVVGVDVGKDGAWLLIFDPAKSPKSTLKEAAESLAAASTSKRTKLSAPVASTSTSSPVTSNAFWSQQPGKGTGIAPPSSSSSSNASASSRNGFGFKSKGNIVGDGISGSGGVRNSSSGLDTNQYSKLLEPYRVSLSSLRRNCEYQILYVEEGPMLTSQQKIRRKIVLSSIIT